MGWSEVISIVGSLGSAVAVAVSLLIFWRQRNTELMRLKNERENELSALKKLILLNCESLKESLKQNMKITETIKSGKYAGLSIDKIGGYFYIIFKDGYTKETGNYYWNTNVRFCFLSKFLEHELLILAKHNQEVISTLMSIYKNIDNVNNLLESIIGDYERKNYSLLNARAEGAENYCIALNTYIDNLILEVSII
ncbi:MULTISPECIES: hypothetical protein [Proteus]|uniref:hypothetical protein n=1 Tax=Proteus TaxID=583 RepID=UPI0013786310|nr:hypothetical protein [Proteus sp. G2672]NBL78155.1 hypothetical protein [Proteus sp. G2672]